MYEKGVALQNSMTSGMNATIRTFDKLMPIWTYRYSQQREIDNNNANIANNYMKMFIDLIQTQPDNQALITENLDYLVFSNDWEGFISLCQETYAKSDYELKRCVQNLYQFSHDAKVMIQGSDDYEKIVSPKVFEFLARNRGKTIDDICEEYKINLDNIIWSKPNNDAYYDVMNKHFYIDNMKYLETEYIDREEFKRIYPYIESQTAFDKNLTSELEYQNAYLQNVIKEKTPIIQSKNNEELTSNPYLSIFNENVTSLSQVMRPSSSEHVDYIINGKWTSQDGMTSDHIIRTNDTHSYTPLLNQTMNNTQFENMNNRFNLHNLGNENKANIVDSMAPYLPQFLSILFTGWLGKKMYNAYRKQNAELPVNNADQEDDIEMNKPQEQQDSHSSSLWDYIPFFNHKN